MPTEPIDEDARREYVNWLAAEVQKGRLDLLGELVESVDGLVWSEVNRRVRRWKLPSDAAEDLYQEGVRGVIEGARKYDATLSSFGSTYVIWRVRSRMNRWIARFRFSVVLPNWLMTLKKWKDLRGKVLGELSQSVELDVLVDGVDHSRGYLGEHFLHDDGESVGPDDLSFRRDLFDHLFGVLDNREREVIHRRLDGESLTEIAEGLAAAGFKKLTGKKGRSRKGTLSHERVRQIQAGAIKKMIWSLRKWDLLGQVSVDGYGGKGLSEYTRRVGGSVAKELAFDSRSRTASTNWKRRKSRG